MWQDYAIAVVVAVFTMTAFPLIRHQVRVPVWTSAPMMLGGLALVAVYTSLNLWYSVCVESVSVIMWSIIFRESVREHV